MRILIAQGWYIVAYCLGIYLLNLFLAFLQPKFDPSLSQDEGLEDGESSQNVLPTKQDEEFRPFIRRLPEFKFWHSATRAIALSLVCSFFEIFNLPVFWPVLVMYWLILFSLTSKSHIQTPIWPQTKNGRSAETNTTYDQISIHPVLTRESKVWE